MCRRHIYADRCDRCRLRRRHIHTDRRRFLYLSRGHIYADRRRCYRLCRRHIYANRRRFLHLSRGHIHINRRRLLYLSRRHIYVNRRRRLRLSRRHIYVDRRRLLFLSRRHIDRNRRRRLRLSRGHMYVDFRNFQFGYLDRNRLFRSRNVDVGNDRSIFFFAFQDCFFRPSKLQDVIEDKHYQPYPSNHQSIGIERLFDVSRGQNAIHHKEGSFADKILPSNRPQSRYTQEQRKNSKVLNPRGIRSFHAVFGGIDRVHNKTHNPNNGNYFQCRRDKASASPSYRAGPIGEEYEHRIMQRIVIQKNVANYHDCRKLQKIADQRDQSTVRAFTFGNTRFIVYVEYADLTAAKAADKVYGKANT